MSCVVAIRDKNDKIFMGSDSLAISEGTGDKRFLKAPKIFMNGKYLIGFVGSLRLGQVIMPDYMNANFKKISDLLEMIREQAHVFGCLINENGEEYCGTSFIIGYEGRLFAIDNYFQLTEYEENFHAVGAGAPYSLGSLYVSSKTDLTPDNRIRMAIDCASYFCSSVGGKIHIIESKE